MQPYYKQDNFALYHGDTLQILRGLPDESFDMIFADPPYFLSNGGFTVHAGKRVKVDKGQWDKSNGVIEDFVFHQKWIQEAKRLLKPNGTIWISGTYHSIYQCGYILQLEDYHILNEISWFKPNAAPNLSCRMFTASHETLIWARKSKKGKHYFDYEAMKEGDWKEDALKKPGLQMRSVWSVKPPLKWEKEFGKHPTQKPIDLLRRIVVASTKPGDIILDPFTGSSTTGIAAELVGERKFIGIDQNKEYLNLSARRFRQQISKHTYYDS